MRILFTGDNVLTHHLHGISRMSRCVFSSLMDIGHTCMVYGNHKDEDLFDDRLQTFQAQYLGEREKESCDTDVIWLLPANGFVGMSDEQRNVVRHSALPIVSIIYDIIPYMALEIVSEQYVQHIQETIHRSDQLITISNYEDWSGFMKGQFDKMKTEAKKFLKKKKKR